MKDIPQVLSLRQDIEVSRAHLRNLLRKYRAEHGFIMRPYYRDLVRGEIKRIRWTKSTLESWEREIKTWGVQ